MLSEKDGRFVRDLWRLVRPYWSSEEKWPARLLLAAIVALTLGMVWINVEINQWQNAFFNSLQDKKQDVFFELLMRFGWLAAAYIVMAVYQLYLNQWLQIRWRRWLTNLYLDEWLAERTYYRMQLADRGTDNPDQRIAEDFRIFIEQTLSLTLGFINALVTLVSFIGILWGLSGVLDVSLAGVTYEIPGYMVWVALAYAALGTWLTHRIGKPLIGLNFNQQRYEADFRFGLVRFRENAEGVALYRGEAQELAGFRHRFADVVANWIRIMVQQKRLTWFTAGYSQVAIIFPYVVAAPRYFSGAIPLGGLMQTASAFSQVQGALSWFIDAYTTFAEWRASAARLITFQHAMQRAVDQREEGQLVVEETSEGALEVRDLDLALPNARPLLKNATLTLKPGDSALLTGPSGCGKSTLFRAIAGIWPYVTGHIRRPGSTLFLPQRPYIPIGPLRRAVTFPADARSYGDDEIRSALVACGLPQLADRLDDDEHWTLQLSPGEQQRLAFARALLLKPAWLYLDEATAALDETTEERLYRLLKQRLPETTLFSIGHRPTLERFHNRRFDFHRDGDGPASLEATPVTA
ncbi:MAG: ABC transporter ATP-binding protein/permease [Betaproteobacteria bacterium]|nr:ABC transporter ATP-binding protein/permease [Betaproteobacteria bacterium]